MTLTFYNFAVLRYKHDVSTGEFVNVGLIMLVDGKKLLFAKETKYSRLSAFFDGFNGQFYRSVVNRLDARVKRIQRRLETKDLFEDLPGFGTLLSELCPGDAALSFSGPMGGLHEDPATRFNELYAEQVTRYVKSAGEDERVTEDSMRPEILKALRDGGLVHEIEGDIELTADGVTEKFAGGWTNGRLHVFSPISFDLVKAHDVRERALRWSGVLYHLHDSEPLSFVAIVAAPSRSAEALEAFDAVMPALERTPGFRTRVPFEDLGKFVDLVRSDLRHE